MAIELLNTFLSLPLEREFEGWITERILEYFESADLQADVWAVSPDDESTWPADEHVWMPGKVFGLQFKRPYVAEPLVNQIHPNYQRLYWPLENDPQQFQLIRTRPEIFYCLPTFTNRKWRKPSLHHCVFWRPPPRAQPARVWYKNDDGQIRKWARNIERHQNGYRWGNFVERVQQCDFGLRVSEFSADPYLTTLHQDLLQSMQAQQLVTERGEVRSEPLLLVNVRIEDQ